MGASEGKQCGKRKNDSTSAPTAASGLRRGLAAVGAVLITIGILGAIGVFNPSVERQSIAHVLPLNESESAALTLDSGLGRLSVDALPDASPDLLTTDLRYIGTYRLDDEMTAPVRTVALTHEGGALSRFNPFSFFTSNDDDDDLYTTIRLTRAIPLDLGLRLGINDGVIDLSQLQLSRLNIGGGLGDITVRLPEGNYDAVIDIGIGAATILVAEEAAIDLTIDGGIGAVTLTLPHNLPVRIDADQGIGGITAPSSLRPLDPQREGFEVGGRGVWESDDYAETPDNARLSIRYSGGIGELRVIRP